MTAELWILLGMGFLLPMLNFPILFGRNQNPKFMEWGFGPRDSGLEFAPWVGRLERAQRNLQENLPTFAILVLVGHLSGRSNEWTLLGAELFMVSRLLHPIAYVAAIWKWRTIVFFLGQAGMIGMLIQLVLGGSPTPTP